MPIGDPLRIEHTDEKIINYLERARDIVLHFQRKYKDPVDRVTNDTATLEIAKMIQIEEKN